ncbi:MAG: GNAT family N-acetyltransferase [Chloroflexota bacterium]
MEIGMIYEIIGYIASALVAISLLMTSILRLRIINTIGAVIFVVYALLIGSYPVAVVNFVIVLINLYQLNKLFRLEDEFRLLDNDTNSSYLQQFIDFHRDEIEKFYPQFFNTTLDDNHFVVFVLRNMLPVGLFIASKPVDGRAVVKLDYVIPNYRDFKVGQYLYRQKTDVFKSEGIRELISYSGNDAHEKYLQRMGFSRDFATSDRRLYRLSL